MRTRPGALLLAALLLGVVPAAADEEPAGGLAARLEGLRLDLVRGLEEHARECARKKALGKRDEAWALVLDLEPDHEEARRWLRYKRDAEGVWKQASHYRRPSNPDRAVAARCDEARDALVRAWRSGVVAACETAQGMSDLRAAEARLSEMAERHPGLEDLDAARRAVWLAIHVEAGARGCLEDLDRAADALRSRFPEDLVVRARLGEVPVEGVWLLVESQRTLAETAGLRAAGTEALARAKQRIAPVEPTDLERRLELPLSHPQAGEHVRTAGTAPDEVLAHLAALGDALGPLLERALGRPTVRRQRLSVNAFAQSEHLDAFLAAYPVVENPTLTRRKELALSVVWADGSTLAIDAVPAVAQYDLCVHTLLNQTLSDTLFGGADLSGWEAEGPVRYLAYLLTGTRFTVGVAAGRYATGEASPRAVPASEDAWLMAARALLAKADPPDLRLLFGKGLDAITAPEATLAYALSVYLLEGHPGLFAPFALSVRRTSDADRSAREVLGVSLPVLGHRLRRWLDEVAREGKNER